MSLVPLRFSDAVRQRLRARRSGKSLDPVEEAHDAILVCSFLSSHYLTFDGRALEVDLLADTNEVKQLTEHREICLTLTVAAKGFDMPELLELLPRAPEDASPCPLCSATRWVPVGDNPQGTVCPRCYGLGWIDTDPSAP